MYKRPVPRSRVVFISILVSAALAGCGGGESSTSNGSVSNFQPGTALNLAFEPNAPTSVNNTASDGLNWFNYRRQQVGLAPVARNAQLDSAAQAHSDYQRKNNVITHDETVGLPGYTGADLGQRIAAAGYTFSSNRFAYGEVISATGSTNGFAAAEDLLTAIYHRFVILEPTFTQAGAGSATVPNGYTYFTTNFTADGLTHGVGQGGFVVYPWASQQNVPTNFFSDREIPDPVPNQNEVGFPISIHADIASTLRVTSFTVRPRGGSVLPAKLLVSDTDSETPQSAAALIPLSPLAAGTTFEVAFAGTVAGQSVTRNWTFTTR